MRRAGLSRWKIPVTASGIFLFFLCTLPVLSCPDCPGFAFCPYCTTQITQASMPPAGFKPAIPEVERPKTYVLDRMTTGIGGIEPAIFRLAVQCSASANCATANPPPPIFKITVTFSLHHALKFKYRPDSINVKTGSPVREAGRFKA